MNLGMWEKQSRQEACVEGRKGPGDNGDPTRPVNHYRDCRIQAALTKGAAAGVLSRGVT